MNGKIRTGPLRDDSCTVTILDQIPPPFLGLQSAGALQGPKEIHRKNQVLEYIRICYRD